MDEALHQAINHRFPKLLQAKIETTQTVKKQYAAWRRARALCQDITRVAELLRRTWWRRRVRQMALLGNLILVSLNLQAIRYIRRTFAPLSRRLVALVRWVFAPIRWAFTSILHLCDLLCQSLVALFDWVVGAYVPAFLSLLLHLCIPVILVSVLIERAFASLLRLCHLLYLRWREKWLSTILWTFLGLWVSGFVLMGAEQLGLVVVPK